MTFKDILVHVDAGSGTRTRLELAAKLLPEGGHVVALHVATPPVLPPVVPATLQPELETIRKSVNAAAEEATRSTVNGLALPAGITLEWRKGEGLVSSVVGLHARYSDLIIVGQSDDDSVDSGLADSVTMVAGRPVLVVPMAGRFSTLGTRVVLGWNGSREATRAINDAMPLLVRAEKVLMVIANPDVAAHGYAPVPGADMATHLARHGVPVVCERVSTGDLGAADLLLNRAADEDADLIVMGAYGHSRLSELVLGGATRHMLRHMTVPVLFSH